MPPTVHEQPAVTDPALATGLQLHLGQLALHRGGLLAGATLAYRTFGRMNAARDNVILLPHQYSATTGSVTALASPGGPVDTDRWFVIAPGQFGAGESTSPSNAARDPGALSVLDDARAHRALLRELGIERLHAAVGFSMGAQQAMALAALDPDSVGSVVAIAGLSQPTPHHRLVVEGVLRATLSGRRPLDRHARMWAVVGLSSDFYRNGRWRELGFETVEDFVRQAFVADLEGCDPRDLAAQLDKWAAFDIREQIESARVALQFVAFSSDELFRPGDIRADADALGAGYTEIGTDSGHLAGVGLTNRDRDELTHVIGGLLDGGE
jgi:homoserine O-acetyltransferase/O-succinyltransferase